MQFEIEKVQSKYNKEHIVTIFWPRMFERIIELIFITEKKIKVKKEVFTFFYFVDYFR